MDIFVDPDRHRQGIALDALTTLMDFLITERGHHRITIDPVLDNEAAVRCYEKAGFRRVGVMERAWCDTEGRWRDCLFMEHVLPDSGA